MAEPLRIRIRSDWDAALTYDSLDEATDGRAVFVGRETLIAPLVAEIVEPNKRGTYLISGYRGTGKTSLLIEALSRAQEQLTAKKVTLFPLVLNVSEVSASLISTDSADQKLNIDPRRLLIALLRTIDNRLRRLATKDPILNSLTERTRFAYEKATATKFAQTANSAQETRRSRSREFALALENKNLLKTVAWLAGTGAFALEAVAWFGPALGWLHAAALALAGVFGVGLTAAYKRTSSDTETSVRQTAFEYDNSLQQLETDLKDILVSLKEKNVRTVVVMEELDKINDTEGSQLDAVIRYFKNLFTQAPALFFFVTDKGYFDVIASAIKRARRGRTYAVEHTFFTHRLFVGRPTTEESLQFIAAIALDEADRARVTAIGETLGKPSRIEEADQFGRFVRCVLFYAANHLFDLKNELRRFVRSEEQSQSDGSPTRVSSFVVDDQTLPPEAAALAVFQDLIIEKSRSFEIKGGRAYANETLADSLYAVFNELGSNQPQQVLSFMPPSNVDPEQGLLLEEQLDLNEVARIREAVLSLVGDLERGRAFAPRDPAADTFTWRPDAARSFRYFRQLEKHEENLIAELQRHAALAKPLADLVKPDTGARMLGQRLEQQVGVVRESSESLAADAAADALRLVADEYGRALDDAFVNLRSDLETYGFKFDLVARGLGGWLFFVQPLSGDPRVGRTSPRGGVLLALGEFETLRDDVWSFINPQATASLAALDRAALVHVIHTIGNVAEDREDRRQLWDLFLRHRPERHSELRHAVDVVALVDPDREPGLTCVQQVAGCLAVFGAWARPDLRPFYPLPGHTPSMDEALRKWVSSPKALFFIDTWVGGDGGSDVSRYFNERSVLEEKGAVVVSLDYEIGIGSPFAAVGRACMRSGDFSHDFGDWDPIGQWLLRTGRVILYIDWFRDSVWGLGDIVKLLDAGARVIFETSEHLPAELQDVPHTTFPPRAEPGIEGGGGRLVAK